MSKDRQDGKYIQPTDGIHVIMPYLFDNRVEAEVYQKDYLDITNLVSWVDKKNETLDYKFTYFQALAAVLVKTVYNRPLLNRFIQGHRMYERNYVSISFIAKDKMADDAEEKLVVLKIDPKENALSMSRRMAIDIFKTRASGTNDLDKFLKSFAHIPRWLMRFIVKFVKWLDYHGIEPKSLWENDSNYQTLLLSNLGSIKCDSCYHHLNNYGTNSIVITIGTIHAEKKRTLVDFSATLDERIADGFYFAKSMKLAQYIIDHPELLEQELSSKIDWEI